MPALRRSAARRRSLLSHRNLLAAEVLLAVGLLKGVLEEWVKTADLPAWGKILFIMASTVGILGSLYWLVEAITSRGVNHAHSAMHFFFPRVAVHASVFFALYLVYAWRLGLPAFGG